MTTVQTHLRSYNVLSIDVSRNTLTMMSTQLQPNTLRDDDGTITQVNTIANKQTALACSSSTVSTCPQPATLVEEGAKRLFPSSFEISLPAQPSPNSLLCCNVSSRNPQPYLPKSASAESSAAPNTPPSTNQTRNHPTSAHSQKHTAEKRQSS